MFGRCSVPATPIFRCPEPQQWVGGLMCAFGSLVGLGIFLAGGTGFLIGPIFALYLGGFGGRFARVAVLERPDGLVVRNRFRTRPAPWNEIATIEFRTRPHGAYMRLQGVRERRCGVCCFNSGDRVWLDATESTRYWLSGTYRSHTEAEAKSGLDAVAAVWQAHRPPV